MTFKVIRGQGQGHVRLKVSKMMIFKIYLLRHFSTNQKNTVVSDTRPKYLAEFLNFLVVIESRNFEVCPKNRPRPILMKLGTS